jgi:hypothetical protein
LTRVRSRIAELGRRRLVGLRRAAAHPRVKRAAWIAAVAIGALYVTYLVAVNALLRFGGVEWFVNSSTDDAHLTLGPSHTWFPGRVEARDLKLRFQDQNVQFELVLAHATARLSLLGLAKKRLHVRAIDADGVRFRFRHKVVSVAGNERRLVHFPRIEGFSDPPILVPQPPTDKTKNWAFLLENVRARGVELWVMEYRYTGIADVRGAFELAPGRKLWVGPARLDLRSGALGVGEKRPLASNVHGGMEFRFKETNPDPIPGLQIFRQISAKLGLDAALVDLEAANLYLSDASKLAVRRGKGTLQARVELVDGRFVRGAFVEVRNTEDLQVALPNAVLEGRLAAKLEARGVPGETTRLVADGSLATAELNLRTERASRPGDVSARSVGAVVASDNADVASPWKLEEASFHIEGGRVPDLGEVVAAPGKRGVLNGGAAWFFARAALERRGSWSGTLRADARGLRIRIGDKTSTLDGTLMTSVESTNRELETGVFRDVALDVTSAENRRDDQPLRVSVRVPSVAWSGFPPESAQGRAAIEAPHVDPLLEAVGAPPMLVSLWPDAPLDASARFAVEKSALDVRLDLAKSGPFRAVGRLRVCSPARAAFLVRSGAFSAGLAVREGGVRVVPLAGDEWLANNTPKCPRPP